MSSARTLVAEGPAGTATITSLADTIPALPAVRTAVVESTGGHDTGTAAALHELHRRCRERSVRLIVDFALQHDADAFAALGRTPTSLRPVLEASRSLRIAGIDVRWEVPVLPSLAYRLEALFSLAHDERVDAVLVAGPPLDGETARFVADFVAYRLLDEESARLPAERVALYQALQRWLAAPATPFRHQSEPVVVLERAPDGHEWTLRAGERPALGAAAEIRDDGAGRIGAAPTGTAAARPPLVEVAGVLGEGMRALSEWARTSALPRRGSSGAASARLPRVLVIGAYGGDHIGDAAILGGVLRRMHARHGTDQAILVSQRPEHSARLAAMLDVPVGISVEDYQQRTVGDLVARVDGVVFAGGPLMDLPKQLVKHLYAVSVARRSGKPFVIEGIGAGPFVRRPSFWTARRLVLMADRITVRTSDDARAPLLRGRQADVKRDPAFDYLESRGPELTRLSDSDRSWLQRLLKDTDGRLVVALNLRPIRPDYTAGGGAGSRAEYTRFVETRFEERLAEGMRRFHKARRSPCFIFFPMNAIQFGSSDLRCAYRVKRLVGSDVDFRVWEADPTIDGVIALLRRVDVAIAMRFHAAIYALAQQRKVIGIDYRPGKRDKVAALLTDFGVAENCSRIDEMTTDWLVQRLEALTA